jgi:hypothetical protein
MGVTDDRGASMIVSVDNDAPARVSTESADDKQHANEQLFTRTGLDPNVSHTLTLAYDPSSAGRRRKRFLRIDSFEVEDGLL